MSDEEELCYRYLQASAALRRGELAEARRAFQNLLLEAPRFAPAWDGLGGCFEAEGDLERAGECYRKAARLDRGNWRSRLNWGTALLRAGRVDEALRWLSDAARIAPEERIVFRHLGEAHAALEAWDAALEAFRRALSLPEREVSDAELYLRIGDAELERGDAAAADAAFSRACLLAPENADVFFRWAAASARAGDRDGAERLARRACALDPRSLQARLFLVELAMDRADWETAAARIEEIAALPGLERRAHALRAELCRRRGLLEEARRLALEVLRREGPPADQAVDSALATLRRLHGVSGPCRGFRLVVEAESAAGLYYRPFVVLAEDEREARWFVAELQDALDDAPWRIAETQEFSHQGEALAGVYQVLLTRVFFPRAETPGSASPAPAA